MIAITTELESSSYDSTGWRVLDEVTPPLYDEDEPLDGHGSETELGDSEPGVEISEEDTVVIRALTPTGRDFVLNSPLSDREMEILQLIVDGHENSTIADHLHITVGTVKTHIRSIFKKLRADTRTKVAVWALRSGLVR